MSLGASPSWRWLSGSVVCRKKNAGDVTVPFHKPKKWCKLATTTKICCCTVCIPQFKNYVATFFFNLEVYFKLHKCIAPLFKAESFPEVHLQPDCWFWHQLEQDLQRQEHGQAYHHLPPPAIDRERGRDGERERFFKAASRSNFGAGGTVPAVVLCPCSCHWRSCLSWGQNQQSSCWYTLVFL